MRVLIIGAGVAGTTLAIFLSEAGFVCEIFERAAAPGGGAALAIASNGLAVLEAAGVLGGLDQACVLAGMWAFENDAGGVLASIRDARRGTPYQTRFISRPVLQSVMAERLAELGIAIQYGKRLADVVDRPGEPVVAHFEDGTSAAGDCIIGADGIGSRVRATVCPEAGEPIYSGMMAVIGFCRCVHPERIVPGSEQRVHLVFGRSCFFEYVDILTPDGPRTVWWSTVETPMPARGDLAAEAVEAVRGRLLALHDGWGEPVPELIRSAEEMMPLPLMEMPKVPRWSAGRVAILGDAAHAIGPHSGQAASMALEDAMLLAQLMRQGKLEEPNGLAEVFRALEVARFERLDRVLRISQRAEGRKQEMTRLRYWAMQQRMRVAVPLGSRKSKRWLLDYRVGPVA